MAVDIELKTQYDQLNRAWEEMKTVLADRDSEIKKAGEAREETKALIDKLNDRIDQLETKMKRPELLAGSKKEEPSEAKAVFMKYCRRGEQNLIPEERKALTLADDTQTGYLAPTEYVNEILKGVVDFSPVRELVRIRTTSQRAVQFPKRTGTFSARWVGEIQERTESPGLLYGLEEIPTQEMYALVDVSLQDLEDSAFDLEAELRMEFSEQFGVAEGAAIINGIGTPLQPEGFLVNAAVGETRSGHASQIQGDSLLGLAYDVKSIYANNGTWVLNRATMRQIRLLKQGTDLIYLWQPGLAPGQPNTIDGRPYVECPDMPNVAANACPIAFGDFNRGYVLVDRLVISVQRDPYSQAKRGMVEFIARRRVGGQVVRAEAIRKYRIAV